MKKYAIRFKGFYPGIEAEMFSCIIIDSNAKPEKDTIIELIKNKTAFCFFKTFEQSELSIKKDDIIVFIDDMQEL